MAFHDREFDTYVALGSPDRPDLWSWPTWSVLAEVLAPLADARRGTAAVRTTQFEQDRKRQVRFGRIGWNRAGHEKWVHRSPKNGSVSGEWHFLDAEIWAPAWSRCERDGQAPDLFVGIRNERFWPQAGERLQFNQVLLLAAATDIGEAFVQHAQRAVDAVSAEIGAVLCVHQRRTWAKALAGGGFTDSIQDLLSTGLFRVGSPHSRPVDPTTFVETWTRVRANGG
jgi:hypothetical protein